MRIRDVSATLLLLLLFVFLPAFNVVILDKQNFLEGCFTFLDSTLVFLLLITLLLQCARVEKLRVLALLLSIGGGGFYLVSWLLIGYWRYGGNQFDILFALDVYQDVSFTLYSTFGFWYPLAVGLAVCLWLLFSRLLFRVYVQFCQSRTRLFAGRRIYAPLLLQLFALMVLPVEQRLVLAEVSAYLLAMQNRSIVAPIFPDNNQYSVKNEKSVFMLQIESGNSMALMGHATIGGKSYTGNFMPELRKVAADGVFIPYFWSNTIQSNRSVISALCGVTNNTGRSLSYTPDKLRTRCVPDILKSAGYSTAFYWAFHNPDFTNLNTLLSSIGFEQLYTADIMEDQTYVYEWGVDDCAFYDQMFTHIKENYDESTPKLVYTKVSSHHTPFSGSDRYRHIDRFSPHTILIEAYLDSFLQQDHCVARFYEGFQQLTGGDAHLMIFADHSWPIGMHGPTKLNEEGAYNENFLVPFIYVPPVSERGQYNTGAELALRPSFTDLPATVFELLSGEAHQNSFVPALRGEELKDYEDCHILVQPYGGAKIAIVKKDDKYIYGIEEKTLHRYDLANDWLELSPEVVAENLSYEELRERYYCDRYR